MDWMNILTVWAAAWSEASLVKHLLNILAGLMGACVYIVLTVPALKVPKVNKESGEIELNFVGILIAGAVCGFVVDYMMPVSLLAGAIFPAVLKLFFSKALPAFMKAAIKKVVSKIDDDSEGSA